jgi:hypothetical protein
VSLLQFGATDYCPIARARYALSIALRDNSTCSFRGLVLTYGTMCHRGESGGELGPHLFHKGGQDLPEWSSEGAISE